ncbi:hypothetical protein VPH35_064042 [Triticum aestivum]
MVLCVLTLSVSAGTSCSCVCLGYRSQPDGEELPAPVGQLPAPGPEARPDEPRRGAPRRRPPRPLGQPLVPHRQGHAGAHRQRDQELLAHPHPQAPQGHAHRLCCFGLHVHVCGVSGHHVQLLLFNDRQRQQLASRPPRPRDGGQPGTSGSPAALHRRYRHGQPPPLERRHHGLLRMGSGRPVHDSAAAFIASVGLLLLGFAVGDRRRRGRVQEDACRRRCLMIFFIHHRSFLSQLLAAN